MEVHEEEGYVWSKVTSWAACGPRGRRRVMCVKGLEMYAAHGRWILGILFFDSYLQNVKWMFSFGTAVP
jgi:hypothetical protein